MGEFTSRRKFLRSVAAGSALALYGKGQNGFRLPAVSAAEAHVDAQSVRLVPEIEPLLHLVEETPRDRIVERVAEKVRQGTTYRQLVAALLLAGVRNIQPRPSVGFKFHAVLVVQSLHLAALASPESDRWLPVFWGLDYFKGAQAQDVREGDWSLGPVRESLVPAPALAAEALRKALDNWDAPMADAAIAGLVRSAKPESVFELLFRYGARDFRSIGHKAIFAANAHRTLGFIGWQHAEPVLRSLVYAFLQHEGTNPATRDAPADLPDRHNRPRAGRLRIDHASAKRDDQAVADLLAALRAAEAIEASDQVGRLIERGIAPQAIWDALFAAAAELLYRQPGIVALHAVTTTNALHYAWRHCREDETRAYLMLQNAAFLAMFREAMVGRGSVSDRRIDAISPSQTPLGREGIEAILATISRNPLEAVGKAYAYLSSGGDADALMRESRAVLLLTADDPHDYKFTGALFEDFSHVGPPWRDRFMAAGVLRLHGSQHGINPLVHRVRAAFA